MTEIEGQTIDFSLYVDIVKTKARMIIIILILGLIIGSVIAYMLPYQTAALVRIGNVPEDTAISPEEIKYQLINDKASKINRTLSSIEPIPDQPYVQLTFEWQDKYILLSEAKYMVNEFISQGRPKYYNLVKHYEKILEELNKQIEALQKLNINIISLVKEISKSEAGLSPEEVSKNLALNSIMLNNQTLLNDLLEKRNKLEWKLSNKSDFAIIINPKMPDPPKKPSRTLVVIVSGVISLLIGYFLAILSELYKKMKN